MGIKISPKKVAKMKLLFSVLIFALSDARPTKKWIKNHKNDPDWHPHPETTEITTTSTFITSTEKTQTWPAITSTTEELTTTQNFIVTTTEYDPDWVPDPKTTDITTIETSTTEQLTTTTGPDTTATTDGTYIPDYASTEKTSTTTYRTLYSLFEDDYSH